MQSTTYLKFGVLAILIFYTIQCSAIRCYNCTSFQDETCGDPFEQSFNESASLVDCDAANDGRNYTFCRKTVQTAILKPDKETTRIIRSCGFLDEPKLVPQEGDDPADLRCYRRTGTHGVELLFCACHADGCNSANTNTVGVVTMFFFSLIACTFSKLLTHQ